VKKGRIIAATNKRWPLAKAGKPQSAGANNAAKKVVAKAAKAPD
jgi:hypothetical protein